MLETQNVAENKSLYLILVGKRLSYKKKTCFSISLSLIYLFTQTLPPTPQRRFTGGYQVALTQISFRQFYKYPLSFNLYLSSSCHRGWGVLPRLSVYRSSTWPHFLFTGIGSWCNFCASSPSLKTTHLFPVRPKTFLVTLPTACERSSPGVLLPLNATIEERNS